MEILNKKVRFDYVITPDQFEAGIMLSGGEVKTIRSGQADLSQSYVRVIGGEIFLINANIQIPGAKKHKPTRTRKLLLHKKEIISIATKTRQKKLTLVLLRLYTKDRLIKAKLALAKPKRKFEKRESVKKKDIEREIQRELKDLNLGSN